MGTPVIPFPKGNELLSADNLEICDVAYKSVNFNRIVSND